MFSLDPTVAFPDLGRLRYSVQTGHWAGVRALLDGRPADDRTTMIWYAAGLDARSFLTAVLAADPADGTARALLGTTLVEHAWSVRTSLRAQHVSPAQFREFRRILRQAEAHLIDAAADDPTDAAVWTVRLTTARGLQLGQSEARRRYDRLAAHHPHHLPGQRQLLQQLCPKWGGDFTAVHAFARQCAEAAPEGAPNGALVADGHLEHIFELDGSASLAYRQDPAVLADLRAAAARSVWHPAYRRTAQWVSVHGQFALAFSLCGDHAAAASQFAVLGGHLTEDPWCMLGDPVAVFTQYRTQALTAAGAPR